MNLKELWEACLGPDEGPWEVEWVSGRDESGNLIRSRRRFLTRERAEVFRANHCGMSLTELMKLMEPPAGGRGPGCP